MLFTALLHLIFIHHSRQLPMLVKVTAQGPWAPSSAPFSGRDPHWEHCPSSAGLSHLPHLPRLTELVHKEPSPTPPLPSPALPSAPVPISLQEQLLLAGCHLPPSLALTLCPLWLVADYKYFQGRKARPPLGASCLPQ